MRRLDLATGLVALALACGRPPATEPPVAAEPAPAPLAAAEPAPQTPPAKPASAGLDPAKAEATALRIMEEVARARALPVTREVAIRVLDRRAVRDFARDALHEQTTPAKLQLIGRIEASLGVVAAGADIEGILLDLLESSVMGIYDPKTQALLIGSHVSDGLLSMVVGHEIAHGLQDMHFDLKRYQEPMDGRSDAESARTFLIEGDAQAAYLAWVSGAAGLGAIGEAVLDAQGDQVLALSGVLEQPILARMLQLPYADGAATVVRLARDHGWGAVDALYRDLPTTSEQMLHLDKLLAREPAVAIEVDPAPLTARLPGYRKVWEDDLGEAALLAMLAEVESVKNARQAAAGWGGDRYLVIERGDDAAARRLPIVVGLLAMDTPGDADEIAPVLRAYFDRQMPGAYLLERRGERILFATQVPEQATRRAIAEVGWGAFRVGAARPPRAKEGARR